MTKLVKLSFGILFFGILSFGLPSLGLPSLGLPSLGLPSTALGSPAECFELAMEQQLFTEYSYERSVTLCKSTGTRETVQCYIEALTLFRVAPERYALSLCKGSPNTSPVACYLKAYEQVDDRLARSSHGLQLCSYGG